MQKEVRNATVKAFAVKLNELAQNHLKDFMREEQVTLLAFSPSL